MNIEQKKTFLDKLYNFNNSFADFCYECLGFRDMIPIHKDLCNFMQFDGSKFKLILMPRYTFKSSIATIGYSLWQLVKNPNERILIYSDATPKALGFLDSIKSHIEGKIENSKFRDYYPAWESNAQSGKWNMDQVIISSRTTAYPEPSIDTGGIETSKVGFHYDIIIFDDVVSDKNITTKDQMDKVADCYKKALSLLKPGGIVLILGTRWHFGDLYGRIIALNSIRQNFSIFIKEAEKDKVYGDYPFKSIGLTKEFLAGQKLEQTSAIYSCIYQNNPVNDETAVFKSTGFSFYGSIKPDDLYITLTCDPAGEGEDFTAITVVGTDNNMDMHILDLVNAHLQPSEIVDKIINFQYKYNFAVAGMEINFFRGMLEMELKKRRDEEHRLNPDKFKLFGVHEFEASSRRGTGKHSRIMALQPFHERGSIKFPGEKLELLEGVFSELSWQMLQYTHDGAKSPHDDLIDALAYQAPLVRAGGLVKKSDLPRYSPAWLEQQSYLKEIKQINMLPRRFRRATVPLSLS